MRLLFIFMLCLISLPSSISQGEGQVNYDQLLKNLEEDIKNGQSRTLRDLFSLLEHKDFSSKVRLILADHTFFTEKEINVNLAKKTELMDFYYQNAEKIKYSEVLNAFFITAIEDRKVDFELKYSENENLSKNSAPVRKLLNKINEQLDKKKYSSAQSSILKIIDFELKDQDIYLNLLRDPRVFEMPSSIQADIYQSLLTALENLGDIEIVEVAMQMHEGGFISDEFVSIFLTNILNNAPEPGTAFDSDVEYFTFLIDSLETFADIRSFGYEKIFPFKMNFFQFPVDYFGKILSLSDDYPWIKQNALMDIQQTEHPRAFFYIAADWYRNWKEDPEFNGDQYFTLLQSITNIKLGIKDQSGKITFDPQVDKVAMRNYFLYWAVHSQDFEWDENRNIFTNKLETLAKTQNYERLFRRLNSRNDTIALNSFMQLAEGDYLEIKSLARKYRQLLRNQNKSLPALKYKYLEQLSQLTTYCREQKVSYKVDKKLAKQLQALLHAETKAEQYQIENKIINSININDITALEYWACLKEKNKTITFSVGRIVDWAYSQNWDKILNDKEQLRLFLKKSYLFENIGISGLCNTYLNKFDTKDGTQQRTLEELGILESDDDILNQIALLLTNDSEENHKDSYSISDFLEDPLVFTRRDIKILPKPTQSNVKEIVLIIKNEEDSEVIKKLFSYLWLHPDIKYIPNLFELIDDQRIVTRRSNLTVSVADNVIPIVENVYGHNFEISNQKPFATEQWRDLWKKDGDNFQFWEQRFFERKLDSLQFFDKLKIDQLNALTESDFYSDDYKFKILDHLKKVKPIRNIRRLSIEPKLSVDTDLKYFEGFFFSYKELDDIPKLFEIDEISTPLMLDFLQKKSASFEISEMGSFYNNLFRAPWLSRYINQGKMSNEMAQGIRRSLEQYLNESEFLSEFEEQITLLNIAQLQFMGKTIQDKIDATLVLDIDTDSKAKVLKSIIATVTYKEIPLVVNRFDQLSEILGPKMYNFLSNDFGIPIFSFNTHKDQESFIRNHKKMTEQEFYAHYLREFGINIQRSDKKMDYQKIYNILSFDIVSPFVGETGGKRDWYIYGIIKLLELNFKDRLGFHEKLNESQTFYSFSSTKRALAWRQYLVKNNLVDPTKQLPHSFNLIYEE